MIKLVLAFLLLMCLHASAQLMLGVSGTTSGGGNAVGPTCNGAIDLTKACMIPMGMGMVLT